MFFGKTLVELEISFIKAESRNFRTDITPVSKLPSIATHQATRIATPNGTAYAVNKWRHVCDISNAGMITIRAIVEEYIHFAVLLEPLEVTDVRFDSIPQLLDAPHRQVVVLSLNSR